LDLLVSFSPTFDVLGFLFLSTLTMLAPDVTFFFESVTFPLVVVRFGAVVFCLLYVLLPL